MSGECNRAPELTGPTRSEPAGNTRSGGDEVMLDATASSTGSRVRVFPDSELTFFAGTIGTPLGVQARYRDGGMPATTGVTLALNCNF